MAHSRNDVALYAAKQLLSSSISRRTVLNQLGSWVTLRGEIRHTQYLIRDIMIHLADGGYVVATVTSARPLSPAILAGIRSYIKNEYPHATYVEIIESIDKEIIGGVVIELPHGTFDVSVRNKLNRLTQGV